MPGLVTATLERVAEIRGDPPQLVFARLFAMRPEFERLFVIDNDGSVRGSMLQMAADYLLDQDAGGDMAVRMIGAERQHHEGFGVPRTQFGDLFIAIRDVARDALGDEWTSAHEAAWMEAIETLGHTG